MRCLVTAHIPCENGNRLLAEGRLGETMESILAQMKPEAAYFSTDANGDRACFIVCDLADPSQIPAVAEPFFFAFGARVTCVPVMVPEDLRKAAPAIEAAAKKYYKQPALAR